MGARMIGHSLWDRVPQKLRLGLVPILTTALLVQAGSQTATLLSCLSRGMPFCDNPSKLSVTDIQGLLILVNFVVVFWFAYRTLGELVTKPGPISLDVKVIGLGTAFLSRVEIYGYALRNGVPERLVFILPVIFFVFIVPFVLLRDTRASGNIDDPSETARQAYSALRQVVVAFVACAAATVAGSVPNLGRRSACTSLIWAITSSSRSSSQRICPFRCSGSAPPQVLSSSSRCRRSRRSGS
ncbi:membrane hypothetical protein [Mesorhizobium prunaredense]|uniref:Uncharacterized protein n=1 Tax=Mesorhizobium prunaredense TaxID=1631249 RepID=A0A1R3VBT8_9HYPH|nr:membrane hypothetical protein [Mesorhizobium prunaredense]